MDDLGVRLHDVERTTRENAVAIERAASDARQAKEEAAEFRPIVLQRSGDEQRRDKYEKNVEQAYEKLRSHDTRIEKVEKWLERFVWIGIGLVVAGQGVWWVVQKILTRAS